MILVQWNIQWCRGMDGRVDPARIARFSADIIEELTRTVPKTEADAFAGECVTKVV